MGETLGLTISTATPTTATSSGTVHTKGSWATLGTASADFAAIELWITGVALNNGSYLIDMDVAGTIYVENAYVRARSNYNSTTRRIIVYRGGSSGDAVRVRCQHDTGSARDVFVFARTISASELKFATGSVSDSYGGLTGTTLGTLFDPGGTANTEVITELTSSLSNTINHITVNWDTEDITLNNGRWIAQLYTGGAGSEVKRGAPWFLSGILSVDSTSLPTCSMFVDETHFTSGTRVSIGVQSSDTDATNRLLYGTAHMSLTSESGGGGSPSGGLITNPGMSGRIAS